MKFNPRHLMELALDEMSKSVAEPRPDGKASPKVGAILVNVSDKAPSRERISRAHRGELRDGDHAEFTLLERKNRDQKLDDCVLFATLEPCAPDARKPPKISCAERIVLARIKEVWVGIEDPDPTVDRKGIKYLQEKGVTVHMFDRDLQEIIRDENRKFIEQAEERAAAAREEREPIRLSSLEIAGAGWQFDQLSSDALNEYRSHAKIPDAVKSDGFNSRLLHQGLLQEEENVVVPTGFGMLLFGKEPRTMMPQAGLLATINYPDGTEEVRDFDGPQIFVPEQSLEWLRAKLPNVIDRSEAKRKQAGEPLFELVREGIVNAIVHRDYDIKGAKCQLVVTPDRIEIRSPGGPVDPITLEQLQSFNAPMLSRNPVLHYVFAKMDLAEERGLGLKSMRECAETAGLPRPRYDWSDPYLTLTLFPSAAAATSSLAEEVLAKLSDNERQGWQWLATKGNTTSRQYAEAIDVDSRTARRHFKQFVDLGLVKQVGKGPATRYEVQ